jgi:hypothetical protein
MSDVLNHYDQLESRLLDALRADLAEAEFTALALAVHEFQRRWNEPYARFCATRPAPQTWREIPAVPLSAFKRYRLSCVPQQQITRTFRTSGTTGETRGEHHFRDAQIYEASVLAAWRRLGLPRLRQVILAPSPADAPDSSLSHMLATLASESDEPQAWCFGKDAKPADALDRDERVALLGTALAFLHLFETSTPRRLVPGSFAMETGGYKGSGRELPKAELYARFEWHFGLSAGDVVNEYSMTELSSQFYARGLGTPHVAPPWTRVLVIDPASGDEVAIGEGGVLRIFDLVNLNSSLAIETQDLAIRREEGFELLGRDPAALPRGCSRTADEMLRR